MPEKLQEINWDNLLNHIQYGSHFMLEYDGTEYSKQGVYGTWHAQFYDGYRASGATFLEALNNAWEMLPNKPSSYAEILGWSPDA